MLARELPKNKLLDLKRAGGGFMSESNNNYLFMSFHNTGQKS